jgi:hypothetical protein
MKENLSFSTLTDIIKSTKGIIATEPIGAFNFSRNCKNIKQK